MQTCYECGKGIKGKVHNTKPKMLERYYGVYTPKAYHPACYAKAERIARLELHGGK